MLNISILIFAIALLIYLIPTLAIYQNLSKYSDKAPGFFLMHIHMGKYLKQYRKISKLKKGKIGPYYALWFVCLGIAVLLIITGILTAVLIK